MIVRDEAHVISETLDSVAPHIDAWVIVDTGSTDGTQAVVTGHLAAAGIPGELHERPWQDFGTNRTEALELCAGKADYAWVIDADDLVVGDLDLSGLKADSYLLRYGTDFGYWRKQLFRLGLRWRYVGAIHEYPACDDPCTEARLEGAYHLESRRLGARSRTPETNARDRAILLDALERDPDDERSAFYLAQTLFDAGDYQGALDWYTRRAEMAGWDEETAYSLLRRGACLEQLGEPWERALEAYLDAWQERPTRAEPLHEIARHYRTDGKYELGYLFATRAREIPPPDDLLFVANDVYAWRARDEAAVCAYYVGRREESFDLCTELLEDPALPEAERDRVCDNRDLSVDAARERAGRYPEEIVRRLARRARGRERPRITATITTCRRPALFERTMNSFLELLRGRRPHRPLDLHRQRVGPGRPGPHARALPLPRADRDRPRERRARGEHEPAARPGREPLLAPSRGRLGLRRPHPLHRTRARGVARRRADRPGRVQPQLRRDARRP